MALQFSDQLRNAMLDSIENIGGASAKVNIYTAPVPTNVAAAATGTLLVQIALPADWMSNAGTNLAGRKDFIVPQQNNATQGGTAAYFRLVKADNTAFMQGTVNTSGADLNLDNTNIATGQSVQITSWQITAPGA